MKYARIPPLVSLLFSAQPLSETTNINLTNAINPTSLSKKIEQAANEVKTQLTTQSPDTLLTADYTQLPTLYAELPRYQSEDDAQQIIAHYNNAQSYISNLTYQAQNTEHKAILEAYSEDLDYAIKPLREKNGDSMLSMLGAPAYTPEQGFLIAGGGIYTFSMDRNDVDVKRSSITAFGMVNTTTNGSTGYGFQSKQSIFLNQNNMRYEGELNFGQQSSNYFGVGFDKGSSKKIGDDTLYIANRASYTGSITSRVSGDWYFGVASELNYVSVIEQSDYILADQDFQYYVDKPLTLGIGLVLEYDSRNFVMNATEGFNFKMKYLKFDEKSTSDSNYFKANIEFRSFYSLDSKNTIATYTHLQLNKGDIPFYDLATVGGSNSMRGIYKGQFIDKTAFETTVEWRHTFSRKNGLSSNHGMTIWSGIASIGENVDKLSEDLFLSYGIGYRYQLQPKMNLRFDLAASEFGHGVYFGFTEAF